MNTSERKAKLPDIYSYHDYRKFLVDWLDHLNTDGKTLSLRGLAELSNLSSAYISLVLSGKRPLTSKAAQQIAPHLSLDASQKKFFIQMVALSEGTSQKERVKAYRGMKKFDQYQENNGREVESFRYLSEWYYLAIRELAGHPNFSTDPKWIQRHLVTHVPAAQIKKAVRFLIKGKFIIKSKEGRYCLPDKNIECVGGVFMLGLNHFHQQILALAGQAIDQLPKEKRDLSGYTFLMSETSYGEILDVLKRTREQIQQIEDRDRKAKDGKKAVYHVEFVTMPLTLGGEK